MRYACCVLWCLGCVTEGPRDPPDVGPVDGDAAPATCVDDRFGPGTDAVPAASLGAGELTGLVLCDARPDWFHIEAAVGQVVRVDVDGAGVSAVRLVAADGAVLAEGVRTVRGVAPVGGLRLSVEGDGGYRLRVDLDALDTLCDPDDGDDAPARAGAVPAEERTVCAGDVDWYRVDAPPGAVVRWEAEVDAGGEVELAVFDATGRFQVDGAARVAAAAGAVLCRIRAAEPFGEARYRLGAAVEPRDDARADSVSAGFRASDRVPGEDGEPVDVPWAVSGLRVDAFVGSLVAASALTDAGEAALEWVADGEVSVETRGELHLEDGRVVRVEDRHGALWRDSPAATHIAATAALGLAACPLRAEREPPVRYRWPSGTEDCRTCFRPGARPVIDLSGRASDPDEWDDAVILHELGHHLAAVYSRDDSVGGRHAGQRIAPETAWSEGWATFFASWVLASPEQTDTHAAGTRTVDLELMDAEDAYAVVDGQVSERLVAAVLWDLFDDGPDDDDAVALPGEVLWAAFAALRDVDTAVTLDRFLDRVVCEDEGAVLDVLRGRDYPYESDCP